MHKSPLLGNFYGHEEDKKSALPWASQTNLAKIALTLPQFPWYIYFSTVCSPQKSLKPSPLSCHLHNLSLFIKNGTLRPTCFSRVFTSFLRRPPCHIKINIKKNLYAFSPVHLSLIRLICRAPTTEPKEGKRRCFLSSPTEDIWGQGGQGETTEKEGDTQEFWMKMGQWSWLLCSKKLLYQTCRFGCSRKNLGASPKTPSAPWATATLHLRDVGKP